LAATKLEVDRDDHDLLDYCTNVADDAQTLWENTACGKGHIQKNLSKLILSKSLETSENQ